MRLSVSSSWQIRPYQKGDEKAINDLFLRVFKVDRNLDDWLWKFKRRTPGHRPLICLGHDKKRIIGQYSALILNLKCGEREIAAAQAVDNMIDPEYRQGLGRARLQKAMFSHVVNTCYKKGIALGYGYPNREAYRVGTKILGYQDLGPIEVRLRSLTWARYLRRFIGSSPLTGFVGSAQAIMHRHWLHLQNSHLKDLKVRRVHDFDKRVNNLWAKASGTFQVGTIRNYSYLTWRFVKRPGTSYTILQIEKKKELLGYIVLGIRKGQVPTGLIVDIFSLPGKKFAEKLLLSAFEFFLDSGVELVECWHHDGNPYTKAIKKYFPRKSPEPIRVVYQIYDETLDGSMVKDIRNWHIQMGDADGV